MKKVKGQLKKLEESSRENSDEVVGIKDGKVRTPAQMMEVGDTEWSKNQREKQAVCHIKNEQPFPKHWSICASLVYEAIRGTVVGVSILELDKAFGIEIICDKSSDNGVKATNGGYATDAYLTAIKDVVQGGATQNSDIKQGKQNQDRKM